MAPKRRAGKEVATSAAEGPSPLPVIERPVAGKGLPLLIRADIWLSLDESRAIEHDLLLLGNPFP